MIIFTKKHKNKIGESTLDAISREYERDICHVAIAPIILLLIGLFCLNIFISSFLLAGICLVLLLLTAHFAKYLCDIKIQAVENKKQITIITAKVVPKFIGLQQTVQIKSEPCCLGYKFI